VRDVRNLRARSSVDVRLSSSEEVLSKNVPKKSSEREGYPVASRRRTSQKQGLERNIADMYARDRELDDEVARTSSLQSWVDEHDHVAHAAAVCVAHTPSVVTN